MNTENERLKSEIGRNRAERRKLLLEAIETRQRLRRPWYKVQYLLQTVLAGIVAAGLLAAWIVNYFEPILKKGNELAKLENKILESKNKEMKHEVERLKKLLEEDVFQFVLERESVNKGQFPEQVKSTLERTRRWQDDEFLFSAARAKLGSYTVAMSAIELPEEIKSNLHNFTGDDAELQKSRLDYLRTVLLILDGDIDHESAIAIWLAGVDQHNRSLEFNDGNPGNVQKHLEEIDAIHSLLTNMVSQLPSNETRTQILSSLDIDHHNMRVMRKVRR